MTQMVTRRTGGGPVAAPALGGTLAACLRESRPTVQVIFQIRYLFGATLAESVTWSEIPRLAAGSLTWFCASFWVYLLNGVMDVTEDQINGSSRPIASGQLLPASALAVARGSALVALVVAALLGWPMLVVTVLMMLLGYTYSAPPFRFETNTVSSALVATAGGLLTYAAGLIACGDHPPVPLLVFAAAMSAWMGLVGIQVKDLSDVAGDRLAGRRTFAVRWADVWVRRLVALTALTVSTGLAVGAVTVAPMLRPSAVVAVLGALALSGSVLSGHSVGSRARRRRPYRIFMLTQYGAHLLLLPAFCL
jgi:4-hydroxybenzoate polyprenyltransferase